MTIQINPDNIHEDLTFGPCGFILCGFIPGFLMFLVFFCLGCFLLYTETPALSDHYCGIIAGFILVSWVDFRVALNIYYASQTIQRIDFNEDFIKIRLYFFRKKLIETNGLKNVFDFKITKSMSQIDTFPQDGTGFFIELKNEKKYRVSPNMQNFETLKHKLLEIVKKETI